MKRNLLLYVAILLLTGCANFAGINWNQEIKNTHWSAVRIGQTTTSFGGDRDLRNLVYSNARPRFCQGKLETVTSLNEAGILKMNSEGCTGCHAGGGVRPSLYAVIRYR